MSRPRFMADHNFSDAIVRGVCRIEPRIEFPVLRDLMPINANDHEVLAYGAEHKWIIVTHDRNTMPQVAYERMAANLRVNGLIIVPARPDIGRIIDDLVLIWATTEADEWTDAVTYLPL